MTDRVIDTAARFSEAMRSVAPVWSERQRPARRLIASGDPFDRLVPGRLLNEAVGRVLDRAPSSEQPIALFLDRLGGGDGARAAAALIEVLAERWPGVSLIHVAFATPSRGAGALVRTTLTSAGAAAGVMVDVVAHNRPFEGLCLSEADADYLLGDADMVVTYAPGAAGSLTADWEADRRADPILARSHAALISFLDPESLVASLPGAGEAIAGEPGVDAVRYRLEVELEGEMTELGRAELGGAKNDAGDRLWVLLDNAKRRRYRAIAEPLNRGEGAGLPVVCPCRTLLAESLRGELAVERIVPAGAQLIAVGRGRSTLC